MGTITSSMCSQLKCISHFLWCINQLVVKGAVTHGASCMQTSSCYAHNTQSIMCIVHAIKMQIPSQEPCWEHQVSMLNNIPSHAMIPQACKMQEACPPWSRWGEHLVKQQSSPRDTSEEGMQYRAARQFIVGWRDKSQYTQVMCNRCWQNAIGAMCELAVETRQEIWTC